MNLFEAIYPQKGVIEHLHQLDFPLNGKVILPWIDDNNAIGDENGNILGFIKPSAENGFELFDKSMNTVGWSNENPHGGFDLYDSNNVQLSFLNGNVFDGLDAYNMNHQLDISTHENLYGGVDIYSGNMELLGSSTNLLSSMNIYENPMLESYDFNLEDAFASPETSNIFSLLDFISES